MPFKRSTYQHGNLRAALIDGALALVQERGVRDFSLAEAARRAGVSGGAPYRHFRDRNELLAAVAARAYRELGARLRAVRAQTPDPIDAIGEMAAAYVRFAAEQRAAFEVLFDAGLSKSAYPELVAAGDDSLAEVIAAASAVAGEDEGRVGKFALTLWAGAHGFAMLMREGALSQKSIDDETAATMASQAGKNAARAMRARVLERASV